MELEADLIEELARFYGYENIPASLPPSKSVGIPSPVYAIEKAVRSIMTGQGYCEAVNLSFASESDHTEFPPHRRRSHCGEKSADRRYPIHAQHAGGRAREIG